jgi:DNA polymerase-4
VPVRLLGIALSHFDDEPTPGSSATQLGLFGNPVPKPPPLDQPRESPRDQALTRALDRIRDRYGSQAIIPARLVDSGEDTGPRVEE